MQIDTYIHIYTHIQIHRDTNRSIDTYLYRYTDTYASIDIRKAATQSNAK